MKSMRARIVAHASKALAGIHSTDKKTSAVSDAQPPSSPRSYIIDTSEPLPADSARSLASVCLSLGDKTLPAISDQRPSSRPAVEAVKVGESSATNVTHTALTAEQATVVHLALAGASLFIGGKAGTGKSFVLRHITDALRRRGLTVSVSASTGIAALNVEGNTFHSTFGVPVVTADTLHAPHTCGNHSARSSGGRDVSDGSQTGVRPHPVHFPKERLRGLDVLVIDEVSLLHAGYLEALERSCRRTPGNNPQKPFGGVQVILSGDFLQLSPFDRTGTALQSNRGRSSAKANAKDRYTCPGVWKHNILAQGLPCDTVRAAGATGGSASSSDGTGTVLPPEVVHPSLLALKAYVASPTVVRRRARRMRTARYNSLPLYESFVFDKCLLPVQLLAVCRQRGDALFLAELNLLRVGQMPWRLARSAYLNDADANAIRLFPTKSAVTNFNACRMLELPGAPLRFRSTLSLATVRQPQLRSGWDVKGARERFLSDPLVLSVARDGRCPSQRNFSHKDADALLAALSTAVAAEGNGPAVGAKHVLLLPTQYQDGGRFGRVVVRVECDALKDAKRWSVRLAQVARSWVAALDGARWVSHHHTATVTERVRMREASQRGRHRQRQTTGGIVATTDSSALQSVPSFSTWTLVGTRVATPAEVLALARPTLQEQFSAFYRTDPLLADKELKIGCRVMLLRNLTSTLANGSLGTIERFASLDDAAALLPDDPLKVQLARHMRRRQSTTADHPTPSSTVSATGVWRDVSDLVRLPVVRMDRTGRLVAIPWITVTAPGSPHAGFFCPQIDCMPLMPAYAFTVHKTQGITFDQSVVFDGENMFPCDHLIYVAASRVKHFRQLRLINVSPRAVTVHKPSLAFCEQLPCAQDAVRQWAVWRSSGAESLSSLFLPNWKTAVPPRHVV